jgi:hypothetical protein
MHAIMCRHLLIFLQIMCKVGCLRPCYAEFFPSLLHEAHVPFHIEHVHPDLVRQTIDDRLFEVVDVFKITNDFRERMFHIRAQAVSVLRDGNVNIMHTFHPSTSEPTSNILKNGFDIRLQAPGPFGKGIHTSDVFEKMDAVNSKGLGIGEIRTMYFCLMIAGKIHALPSNTFVQRITEPVGCDSVQGYFNHAPEIAVYSSDRIIIRYVILYRRRYPFVLPPPLPYFNGFFIPTLLLEFVRNIQQKSDDALAFGFFEFFFQGKITYEKLFSGIKKLSTLSNEEQVFKDFKEEHLKCQPLLIASSSAPLEDAAPSENAFPSVDAS